MSHHPSLNCLNCGAELQGEFCHACGQKAVAMHVGMHDFLHEAAHEFAHWDGKILQTVKLLIIKPGQLTKEFLAGRRARYLSPLRLYLTVSLIFFTLAAILPTAMEGMVKVGPGKGPGSLKGDTEFERRLSHGLREANRDAHRLREQILHNIPRAMFVLMPVFGLLTWAFYRRQQPFYIPHLYYSVHFHAFAFLVWTVFMIAVRLGLPRPLAGVIFAANVPYHYIGLRRVYGGSRAITFVKGTALGFLYWLIVALTMIGITLLILINL